MSQQQEQGICVIVGGGICGILAAAGAAASFSRVVICERDDLTGKRTGLPISDSNPNYQLLLEGAAKRKSILQGLHTHVLMPGGAKNFEQLLPGFIKRCAAQNAHLPGWNTPCNDKLISLRFGGQPVPKGTVADPRFKYICATRILIERCAHESLLATYKNVSFRSSCKVASLLWSSEKAAVTGVKLSSGEEIGATLVIDTSGARSRVAADFLESIGRGAVPCTLIDPGLSYQTRYFRTPEREMRKSAEDTRLFTMHTPLPPDTTQLIVLQVENNLYQANLALLNKTKCGPGLEEFLSFFRTPKAPNNDFYDLLKDAEPVGDVISWLGAPGTRRHHFEQVDMPDGYLVLGDALCSLNPRFGTGMSVSAFQAVMLQGALASRRPCDGQAGLLSLEHLKGFSNQVERKAAKIVQLPYNLASAGDLAFDFCKGPRSRSLVGAAVDKYMNSLVQLMTKEKGIATTMLMVTMFEEPASNLYKPSIAFKVLSHMMTSAWKGYSGATRMLMLLLATVAASLPLQMVARAAFL